MLELISANVAIFPFPFEDCPELIDTDRFLESCPEDMTMGRFRFRYLRYENHMD